ncbi:MAG TPA: hypothetical protein VKK31_08790 [Thermoanaerobaculia bacterium]|nr:hypothetical protein [Thermoanaerobaculia bacterium]
MTVPKLTLPEGKKHLARVLALFEEGRWQLLGILHSLPEPLAELGEEDVAEELDGLTEMRTVIRCVLEDSIRPAIQDLQDVATSTVDGMKEGEAP